MSNIAISRSRMSAQPPPPLPFQAAPLRRASGEPLYAQPARDLAARVRRGTLPPGARLPPEPALAQAYGVNRLTVREALTSLTRQGLVRRVHGVGSFVADTPVRHRIGGDEASLTEAMRRQGLTVRQDLLETASGPRRSGARRAVPGLPRGGHDPLDSPLGAGRSV